MCDTCREICSKFSFRCVECDYTIHDHCYPLLPQTLKHECHCDPLILNPSKIKDFPEEDEKAEFYCHACEELRTLSHPTYYCAGCHFVAHVHCVISEVLPYLDKESLALAAKVENTKLEEATDMMFLYEDDNFAFECTTEDPVHEEATVVTEEVGEPEGDHVLRELNEKIASLQTEVDKITKELARLKERQAQHIASGVTHR